MFRNVPQWGQSYFYTFPGPAGRSAEPVCVSCLCAFEDYAYSLKIICAACHGRIHESCIRYQGSGDPRYLCADCDHRGEL